MRVELHRHGGFAPRPVHVDVDTTTLAPETAARVEAAVSRVEPQPQEAGGDRRIFDLAVTDDQGRREFRFVEPLDPGPRDLVALLLSLEAP